MRKAIESLYARLSISPIWHNRWVLSKSFTYYRGIKWSKNKITIPKGFIFDGASLPRVFYIIWTPMWTDTLIAALLHDYIYRIQTMSRQEADELFNEVMIVTDVNTFKRINYYLWVRIWGWVAWKNNKNTLQSSK